MKKCMPRRSLIILLISVFTIYVYGQDKSSEREIPSLKKVFEKNFLIGSGAMHPKKYLSERYFPLIIKNYNTLTINTFYPAIIHPKEGLFRWKDSDYAIEFAVKNNLKIRGHVLVWHKEGIGGQWMLKDSSGVSLGRDAALAKMKEHIQTIAKRYRGKVWAWDVVNEAVDVKEVDNIKKCLLKEVIGPDYIEKAFLYAHEADPEAKLFYNDFNECNPRKREAIFKLIKSLLEKGIPVSGLGMQMHTTLERPSIEELEKAIELYSKLGIDIHITEMDIDMNPEGNLTVFTDELNRKQAERYKEIFSVFKKYNKFIKAVYTWGIDDSLTWLKDNKSQKRANWPLLFDENLEPKAAFWSIVN